MVSARAEETNVTDLNLTLTIVGGLVLLIGLLSAPPEGLFERDNLAGERPEGSLDERRRELLRWAARVEAAYETSGGARG